MTPDGKIKVLDFGLAKAAVAETPDDPMLSPTLTSTGTRVGVVLGTAASMSPEQAKGLPVDRRADVWAFGTALLAEGSEPPTARHRRCADRDRRGRSRRSAGAFDGRRRTGRDASSPRVPVAGRRKPRWRLR